MALSASGNLYTWGGNGSGQLGDGTTTDRHTPARVLTGITAIAAGSNGSMALRATGDLYTWGSNGSGQIGDGTTIARHVPVRVLTGVTAISAGRAHSMALRANGDLYTWGDNWDGQIGNGNWHTPQFTPVRVLTGVVAISAGSDHSMALLNTGHLYAWGTGLSGRIGDGGSAQRVVLPVRVPLTGVVAISAGGVHSLALRFNGDLYTWGAGWQGAMGDGTETNRLTPTQVLSGVSAISAGSGHSMALRDNGDLYTWGDVQFGQLGASGPWGIPRRALTEVSAFSASGHHSMALRDNGDFYAWGRNHNGAIGDGTSANNRFAPVRVRGVDGIGYLDLTDDTSAPQFPVMVVSPVEGGSASAFPTAAVEWGSVVLFATPNAGQRFVRWEAPGVAWAVRSSETTNPATLIMPSNAVTVTPVFEPIPVVTPTATPTTTPTTTPTATATPGTPTSTPGTPTPSPTISPSPLPTPPVSAWVCPTTASLSDVTVGSQFHCYIEWLAATEITTGWPDGTFRPIADVERQAMAAFLYRGLANSAAFDTPNTAQFRDKPTDGPFFRHVEWLAGTGITTGWPDGTFRPSNTIERQAMAAFLYRAAGSPGFTPPATPTFSDVPRTSLFFAEIEWLAQTGITTGWPDGTFRPTNPVERQAMAAFLSRAFNSGHLSDANLNRP